MLHQPLALTLQSASWKRLAALLAGCMLATSAPATAAPTPEDVVLRLYHAHRRDDDALHSLKAQRACFTPTLQRWIARAPRAKMDPLVCSESGWYGYQVGQARVAGRDAVVPIKLYSGRWPLENGHDMTEVRRVVKPRHAEVYLTDVGNGFQIYDIRHLPYTARLAGKTYHDNGLSLRNWLRRSAR